MQAGCHQGGLPYCRFHPPMLIAIPVGDGVALVVLGIDGVSHVCDVENP